MEANFTFRNTEATEALRGHTLDKLTKLDKYLPKPVNAHIIIKVEGFRHLVEIAFHSNGVRYFGKGESNDMYTSIDDAVSKIEHQLRKSKERIKGHKGE
jgi:putative sigma-54 modulation protein